MLQHFCAKFFKSLLEIDHKTDYRVFMELKNIKNFDAVVCGNTPGALLLTRYLKSQNKVVALAVEQPDAKSLEQTLTRGWMCQYSFLPDREEIKNALQKVSFLMPTSVSFDSQNNECVTFEAGFKPFLGFGDTEIEAANHYVPFFENSELKTSSDWTTTSLLLLDEIKENILWGHELTAVELDSGKSKLTFNGKTVLTTDHVYYGLGLDKIEKIFEDTKEAKQLLQKMKKSQRWTCLSITFEHDNAFSPKQESHILMGAKQIPTLGKFFPTETGYRSVWFSFIPEELAIDDDYVAGIIKEIKRQLKRAYPEEFDKKLNAKTSVGPYQVGQIEQNKDNSMLSSIPGWSMFETSFGPYDGLAGDIFNVAGLIAAD